jgi:hypothetical protein
MAVEGVRMMFDFVAALRRGSVEKLCCGGHLVTPCGAGVALHILDRLPPIDGHELVLGGALFRRMCRAGFAQPMRRAVQQTKVTLPPNIPVATFCRSPSMT